MKKGKSKFILAIISVVQTFSIQQPVFAATNATHTTPHRFEQIITFNSLDSSIDACYPKILNAALQKEINQAKAKQAEAPFDTKLNAFGLQRAGSSYDTSYQKIEFEKKFYDSPVSAYTGFDILNGYVPQYDSNQVTSTLGREFIGVKLNLLSGFAIDKDRLKLYNSLLDNDKATYENQLAKLLVKSEALKSYIKWIMAGKDVEAYKELLNLAKTRQDALEKRLKAGDIAEIYVKENYNYILKRQVKLMSAQDYFNQASLSLAIYIRDGQCNIIKPKIEMLPKHLPNPITLNNINHEDVNKAITNRPEIKILNTEINQVKNEQRMASTELLPKLNLAVQYNQNNSNDTNVSYFKLNKNEGVAKLDFSLPLERSYAKGLDNETYKKLQKLQNEKQLLSEQIANRLHSLQYTINNTNQQIDLAKQEFSLSKQLLDAEEKRLNAGDSSYFLINSREENLTNSYISMLNNLEDNYNAHIEYNIINGRNIDIKDLYKLNYNLN